MADVNRTVGIIFQGHDSGATSTAQSLTERIDALGLRGMKAADALAILARNTADADAAAKKAAGNVGDLGKSTQDSGAAADLAGQLFGRLQAVLAALGVAKIVSDFVDANAAVQKINLTLQAVTGSSNAAAAEFDFVRSVARRLGIDVEGAANSYAQLIAASKGTQLEGEPTRRIFEAVAAAMATLGKSTSETSGVLNAITQIISKGTVQSEELRGQIGDRLPGAFGIAARAIGVTTEELSELLKKGEIGAASFLPKFAEELNRTFASDRFDAYGNNVARLKSSLELLYVAVGDSGIFEFFNQRLKTSAGFFDQLTVGINQQNKELDAFILLVRGQIDYEQYLDRIQTARLATQRERALLDAQGNQTLAETGRLLRQNAEIAAAAFASNQTDAETKRLIRQNAVLGDIAKNRQAVNDALKSLGVDPKKFTNDIEQIGAALEALFKNPETRGDQALAGLEAALKRVRSNDDLNVIGGKLAEAFQRGDISRAEFDRGVAELVKTQGNLNKGLKESTDSIDKQAKSADAAKKSADTYRLELEKLASNERIKSIEATVTLKVAQLENDTKRVLAAFDSINNTVNSTQTALGDLFGLFKDPNLSFQQLSLIKQQIDLENKRRDDALKLQGELTRAQIDQLRAQTQAIEKGDSLIKIDGAGLQPHLEAFMFEILRTIQVRVNQDGLKLLLGT